MLREVSSVKGYAILGVDGYLGTISDLLFDDTTWKLRWLVVNTRHWFPSREVLLPVSAWGCPDPARRQFTVKLTMQQIKDSPGADSDRPVSRQTGVDLYGQRGQETSLADNHCEDGVPGSCTVSALRSSCAARAISKQADPHLRSVEAVLGHRVNAIDEVIGHIDELLVDATDWSIRYFKVDTRDWRRGNRVLIPPRSIRAIDWREKRVYLHVSRQKIESSPPYGSPTIATEPNTEVAPVHWGIKWIKA
ncbi:MAG: PRC-barrel domain-containing protein [Nitrospirota bacterium]